MSIFKKIQEHEAAVPVTKTSLTKSIVTTSLILTTLSVAITAYITTAWFSSNRQVDNGGMNINIDTAANLVIAWDNATAQGETISTVAASHNRIDFVYNVDHDTALYTHLLTPVTNATAKWGTGGAYESEDYTGLEYNTNPYMISADTGYSTATGGGSNGLRFAVAQNPAGAITGGSTVYYKDYTVRIASTGKAMVSSTGKWALNASLNATLTGMDATQRQYHYASSVDFYLGTVDKSNYVGTLNLKHQDPNATGPVVTTLDLFQYKTGENVISTIPLNTEGSILVTMRMYFDGALEKTTGQAYVYSSNLLDDTAVTLNVHFEAEEAPNP